jgi:hypothetical protein
MPETWGPYRAAYIIVAVVYGGYAFSIWWRTKRAKEKLERMKADPSLRSG